MMRHEVHALATKHHWQLIAEREYVDVFEQQTGYVRPEKSTHASRKYLFVGFTGHDEYDPDDTRLVIPYKAEIFTLDDDDDRVLIWWFEGHEGSDDDWWNQLSKEEQAV